MIILSADWTGHCVNNDKSAWRVCGLELLWIILRLNKNRNEWDLCTFQLHADWSSAADENEWLGRYVNTRSPMRIKPNIMQIVENGNNVDRYLPSKWPNARKGQVVTHRDRAMQVNNKKCCCGWWRRWWMVIEKGTRFTLRFCSLRRDWVSREKEKEEEEGSLQSAFNDGGTLAKLRRLFLCYSHTSPLPLHITSTINYLCIILFFCSHLPHPRALKVLRVA